MTGGLGADTFKVDSGSDIIVDLGGPDPVEKMMF